jgi:hypothetical protein
MKVVIIYFPFIYLLDIYQLLICNKEPVSETRVE